MSAVAFLLLSDRMPKKSNAQKKAASEAAGKKPKLTKQQENAGQSKSAKKAAMQAKRQAARPETTK